jgi:hypothetical protein
MRKMLLETGGKGTFVIKCQECSDTVIFNDTENRYVSSELSNLAQKAFSRQSVEVAA